MYRVIRNIHDAERVQEQIAKESEYGRKAEEVAETKEKAEEPAEQQAEGKATVKKQRKGSKA